MPPGNFPRVVSTPAPIWLIRNFEVIYQVCQNLVSMAAPGFSDYLPEAPGCSGGMAFSFEGAFCERLVNGCCTLEN